MTVYIEKPAVNLREELASLRNQGGYEEQQFYFDGLVTNGTFDADISGWTDGNAEGIISWNASGYMDLNRNSGNGSSLATQTITTTVGSTYMISFDIVSLSHGLIVYLGGVGSSVYTTTGTKTFTAVADSSTELLRVDLLNSATATATIDNISVFETDGTNVVHRMPKGWVPLHVYEDGLLQREGAANDYEVVYDGFDYYVKPAVAPSATTQTCVIGVRK